MHKAKIDSFSCSYGWITRFKSRHSISRGKFSAESNSVDQSSVQNWLKNECPALWQGYEARNIFNGDETGLYFKCLPDKTLRFKGEKCKDGKNNKEILTIWICASFEGEKRKILTIGKFLNPSCFKREKTSRFKYFANKNAG